MKLLQHMSVCWLCKRLRVPLGNDPACSNISSRWSGGWCLGAVAIVVVARLRITVLVGELDLSQAGIQGTGCCYCCCCVDLCV